MKHRPLLLLLIAYLLPGIGSGQPANDSGAHNGSSIAIDSYYHALGDQAPIYNGSEYIDYAYTLQDGHPFFITDAWANGTIYFEDMVFTDIPMLYDIVKEKIVIRDFQRAYKIDLPVTKVKQFILSGHTFIRIIYDSANKVKTGFYDRLYNGKIAVFARREKKMEESYVGSQINNVVIRKTSYLVRNDGRYYSVKNMPSLLGALKSKRREVQQYLKQRHIKFKIDPEKALVLAAEYFDQLN